MAEQQECLQSILEKQTRLGSSPGFSSSAPELSAGGASGQWVSAKFLPPAASKAQINVETTSHFQDHKKKQQPKNNAVKIEVAEAEQNEIVQILEGVGAVAVVRGGFH